MSSDERLITERQRFQNGEDGEENIKYWNFFSQFLDTVNAWDEYKFIITTKVKQQYQWFKYSNLPANGMITKPGSTRFLIPCNTDDLQKICTKAESGFDADLFKFALPVVALGCYDPRSKIAKAIATHLTLQKPTNHRVETLHSTRVSVSKPKEVISFIPELKDFEAKYPSLTNLALSKDDFLLWLYDQPERDMMALHIGRAASLPQGGVQAGETDPVEHSYRNVIILKGQPFVGKSWFNNWLIAGFESCGLTTSVIHDLGRQFGHAEWVGSAWSYLDDTTETMISHFFNSAVLKTVASNGLINAESKGVDHLTVKAFTAPILLANNIDSRHLANCDEGNANRIKIVACKDLHGCKIAASEIKPGSPLYGVNSVIPAETFIPLANKAGVSAEVLAMYFIRLCLDYFESFSMQDLATKVNRISQELYETYVSNGMNILAKSAVLSYLLKHNLTNEEISLLQVKFSEAGNSAPFILDSLMSLADLDCRITYETQGLIKSLIKQHWLRANKDSTHPWVTHRNYSTTLITKLGTLAESQKENLTRKGRDSVPLEKVYHAVFHELRDSAGNPSVYSISRVQDAWKAALILNFNYVIEIYYFIIDELAAINKLSTLKAFQDSAPLYHQVFTKLGVTASNPLLDLDDDYFINYVEPEASSIIAAADPRNRFKT